MDSVAALDRGDGYRAAGLWTDDTLAGLFEQHVSRHPDALAVVDGTTGREVSYGQLHLDVCALAGHYVAHGVEQGDTVSVQLPNGYPAAVAHLAAFFAGAVVNPLLPNYRARELRHILATARTKLIVTPAIYRSFDFPEMIRGLEADLPSPVHHLVADDTSAFEGSPTVQGVLDERRTPLRGRLSVRASNVSEVIFTSGTESAPKAVMHTEQTLGFAIRNVRRWMDMGRSEIVWMPSPVGHSTGLNFGIRFALASGYPVVLQDIWDPHHAVDLIDRYHCTYTLASTTFLNDLVRAADTRSVPLGSMSRFCCGGAPVPAELVAAADGLGIGVLRVYGSTELILVSWTRHDAPLERRVRTDGSIMPHVEVEVRDDDGNRLDDGAAGELVARSPSTSVGFAFDPARTAATFSSDGWVKSGDLVTIEGSELTVVGRKKEIIIRGGLNIAPREIEEALQGLREIDDVSVIGVPDGRLGEIVCACVVLAQGASPVGVDEAAAYLTRLGMARYKHPQRIEVVDDLPRTPSGKVQKHVLRERLHTAPRQTD